MAPSEAVSELLIAAYQLSRFNAPTFGVAVNNENRGTDNGPIGVRQSFIFDTRPFVRIPPPIGPMAAVTSSTRYNRLFPPRRRGRNKDSSLQLGCGCSWVSQNSTTDKIEERP